MNAHPPNFCSHSSPLEGDQQVKPASVTVRPTSLVSRVLEDIQADYERQSGQLSWDDIHQVVLHRARAASDAVAVWQEASVRFPLTVDEARPVNATAATDKQFLTPSEERSLTRRVAVARLAAEADRVGILPDHLRRVIFGMGKAAFDRMVLSNMGLVGTVAAVFAKRTTRFDLEDLHQEGVLGLIRAIERFDPDRGYRFGTYAMWWIRQQMQRAIDAKARTIRLPSYVNQALRGLKKKRFRLQSELGRSATVGELARELGMADGEVNLLLRVERDADLIEDIPRKVEGEATKSRRSGTVEMSVLSEIDKVELSELIQGQLRCLDRRARFILVQRFELEGRSKYTLQRLGDKFDLTRERIRQIAVRGLARLSEGPRGEALRDYIEE